MLDLKVKMININPDQHHEILEKCPVLAAVSYTHLDVYKRQIESHISGKSFYF